MRKTGAKILQNNCIAGKSIKIPIPLPQLFLSEEEKKLCKFLEDSPKPYSEIVKHLMKEAGIKDRRTVNNILKELESSKVVFRVDVDGKIFYRFNNFPNNVNSVIALADGLKIPFLLEIKEEILRYYPAISFEEIIEKWINYLKTDPKNKPLIKMLRELKNGAYFIPFHLV